ncbi:PIG-L family deacetylase [Desulfofundulus thermobenzoicus]|uniref:PIG-L family deacetylase n=1 Tax=Desulfofundulus thermobenzoicus TaxID=29376 RepID=A0A6N7IM47_9FIRM|nr:PIG-L family deacetylase [Desulfofundulus thermobenzoicus]MQL50994.1 PIG-L family deacetylase [Desulfofundulus thermobenzoicus]HHW43469.1 PIG-L family deacetylase [Desulfotomaculum sp.]
MPGKIKLISRKWMFLVVALVSLLLITGLFFYFFYPQWFGVNIRSGNISVYRVLVVAPHPDDETLGSGGIIARAVKQGTPVKVIIVTYGDGFTKAARAFTGKHDVTAGDYKKLGETRRLETIRAMETLGLPEDDVIFLGFPDGGMRHLWDNYWDHDCPFTGINGSSQVPYTNAWQPGVPYCGERVVETLTKIITEFKPTDIYVPDPGDEHPDHWAVNAFVLYTLTKMNYQAKLYTYLVHRGYWPEPLRPETGKPLRPPKEMVGIGTNWMEVPLSPEEINLKSSAINCYDTQKKVMGSFLRAFIRSTELFGTSKIPVVPDYNESLAISKQTDSISLVRDARANSSFYRFFYRLERNPDLSAVGMLRQQDRLWLVLQTVQPFSSRVSYRLDMRFFFPDGTVKRLDYRITGRQVQVLMPARNSLNLPPVQIEGDTNRLLIAVPAGDLEGARSVLMDGEAYHGSVLFDKTDYRLFNF